MTPNQLHPNVPYVRTTNINQANLGIYMTRIASKLNKKEKERNPRTFINGIINQWNKYMYPYRQSAH